MPDSIDAHPHGAKGGSLRLKATCQIFFFAFSICLLIGCAQVQPQGQLSAPVPVTHGFSKQMADMASAIPAKDRVAVVQIYDSETGNICSLGNQWRDRIEAALRKRGVSVVERQELMLLLDDAALFGPKDRRRGDLMEKSGADVLVSGKYTIDSNADGRRAEAFLTIKAERIADGSLLSSVSFHEPLGPRWQGLASRVWSNAYQQALTRLPGTGGDAPSLSARLDRNPPCYPPGVPATLTVHTDPGVHLYIMDLAADHTVTLLYPNRKMPDQAQATGRFTFPPASLGNQVHLVFYPLKKGQFCQEAIKVVASRRPLDFSFLPVPMDAIYSGGRGGDMKRMLDVLKNAKDWRGVVVPYGVGGGCGESAAQ